eukprot:PhM_4_TR10433/c0_g1_i1/m.27105
MEHTPRRPPGPLHQQQQPDSPRRRAPAPLQHDLVFSHTQQQKTSQPFFGLSTPPQSSTKHQHQNRSVQSASSRSVERVRSNFFPYSISDRTAFELSGSPHQRHKAKGSPSKTIITSADSQRKQQPHQGQPSYFTSNNNKYNYNKSELVHVLSSLSDVFAQLAPPGRSQHNNQQRNNNNNNKNNNIIAAPNTIVTTRSVARDLLERAVQRVPFGPYTTVSFVMTALIHEFGMRDPHDDDVWYKTARDLHSRMKDLLDENDKLKDRLHTMLMLHQMLEEQIATLKMGSSGVNNSNNNISSQPAQQPTSSSSRGGSRGRRRSRGSAASSNGSLVEFQDTSQPAAGKGNSPVVDPNQSVRSNSSSSATTTTKSRSPITRTINSSSVTTKVDVGVNTDPVIVSVSSPSLATPATHASEPPGEGVGGSGGTGALGDTLPPMDPLNIEEKDEEKLKGDNEQHQQHQQQQQPELSVQLWRTATSDTCVQTVVPVATMPTQTPRYSLAKKSRTLFEDDGPRLRENAGNDVYAAFARMTLDLRAVDLTLQRIENSSPSASTTNAAAAGGGVGQQSIGEIRVSESVNMLSAMSPLGGSNGSASFLPTEEAVVCLRLCSASVLWERFPATVFELLPPAQDKMIKMATSLRGRVFYLDGEFVFFTFADTEDAFRFMTNFLELEEDLKVQRRWKSAAASPGSKQRNFYENSNHRQNLGSLASARGSAGGENLSEQQLFVPLSIVVDTETPNKPKQPPPQQQKQPTVGGLLSTNGGGTAVPGGTHFNDTSRSTAIDFAALEAAELVLRFTVMAHFSSAPKGDDVHVIKQFCRTLRAPHIAYITSELTTVLRANDKVLPVYGPSYSFFSTSSLHVTPLRIINGTDNRNEEDQLLMKVVPGTVEHHDLTSYLLLSREEFSNPSTSPTASSSCVFVAFRLETSHISDLSLQHHALIDFNAELLHELREEYNSSNSTACFVYSDRKQRRCDGVRLFCLQLETSIDAVRCCCALIRKRLDTRPSWRDLRFHIGIETTVKTAIDVAMRAQANQVVLSGVLANPLLQIMNRRSSVSSNLSSSTAAIDSFDLQLAGWTDLRGNRSLVSLFTCLPKGIPPFHVQRLIPEEVDNFLGASMAAQKRKWKASTLLKRSKYASIRPDFAAWEARERDLMLRCDLEGDAGCSPAGPPPARGISKTGSVRFMVSPVSARKVTPSASSRGSLDSSSHRGSTVSFPTLSPTSESQPMPPPSAASLQRPRLSTYRFSPAVSETLSNNSAYTQDNATTMRILSPTSLPPPPPTSASSRETFSSIAAIGKQLVGRKDGGESSPPTPATPAPGGLVPNTPKTLRNKSTSSRRRGGGASSHQQKRSNNSSRKNS